MRRTTFICEFKGKRTHSKYKPKGPCGLTGCKRKAHGWAVYVWGAAQLCEKHLKEECG